MGGNAIEILPEYDASIARLIGDIDGARQLLHLLYCIFADDDRGGRVVEALLRARARGVGRPPVADQGGAEHGAPGRLTALIRGGPSPHSDSFQLPFHGIVVTLTSSRPGPS